MNANVFNECIYNWRLKVSPNTFSQSGPAIFKYCQIFGFNAKKLCMYNYKCNKSSNAVILYSFLFIYFVCTNTAESQDQLIHGPAYSSLIQNNGTLFNSIELLYTCLNSYAIAKNLWNPVYTHQNGKIVSTKV